jgi:predicted amidophosphoribosyltransferase
VIAGAGSALRYADANLDSCTPVPAAGRGVCAVCRSGPGPGLAVCRSCTEVMRQVSYPTQNVVPISLYTLDSQLWHVLRYYKDASGPGSELFGLQVAAIIARFTARHLRCVASLLGGDPALVTSVPSTRPERRPGRHPLETAIARAGALATRYARLLVRGPASVDHKLADDDAFVVPRRLSGERVLVVDDTLTSGARLQSAVSALRLNGASAVAAIVVGRVIDPGWNDNSRLIWDRARETPFSFDQCCLCRLGGPLGLRGIATAQP